MTLDCNALVPIKGHFCSLLISNIFCDPLFLLIFHSTRRFLHLHNAPTQSSSFSNENTVHLSCSSVERAILLWRLIFSDTPDRNKNFWFFLLLTDFYFFLLTHSHIYINYHANRSNLHASATIPIDVSSRQSLKVGCLFNVSLADTVLDSLKSWNWITLPLACTFLSALIV